MGEESTSSEGYIFVKTQICFALFGIVSLNVMKNTYIFLKTFLIPPNYFQAIGTKTRGVELISGKSYLVGRDPLVCFH